MEICSPVASNISISLAGACSLISRAREMSSSVVSPRALTTTITWLPAWRARIARRAAAMMRSAVATLLPPNFCTTRGKVGISYKERRFGLAGTDRRPSAGCLFAFRHDRRCEPCIPGRVCSGRLAPLASTASGSVDKFRAFSPCSQRERALRIDSKKEVSKPK